MTSVPFWTLAFAALLFGALSLAPRLTKGQRAGVSYAFSAGVVPFVSVAYSVSVVSWVNLVVALFTAVGVFLGKRWARLLFLIALPLISTHFAADLPDGLAYAFMYVAVARLLTTRRALDGFGIRSPSSAMQRITRTLLALAVLFTLLVLVGLVSSPLPAPPGESTFDYYMRLERERVTLETALLLMVNYVGATVILALPSRPS